MIYCDLVDRGEIVRRIRKASEKERSGVGDQSICRGLDLAAEIIGMAEQHSGWNDTENTEVEIPAGIMLLLELTEGEKQFVTRGWWDEYNKQFRTVQRVLTGNIVTGWQMLPQPRREKRCLSGSQR